MEDRIANRLAGTGIVWKEKIDNKYHIIFHKEGFNDADIGTVDKVFFREHLDIFLDRVLYYFGIVGPRKPNKII